jgi:hypothetical protein
MHAKQMNPENDIITRHSVAIRLGGAKQMWVFVAEASEKQ